MTRPLSQSRAEELLCDYYDIQRAIDDYLTAPRHLVDALSSVQKDHPDFPEYVARVVRGMLLHDSGQIPEWKLEYLRGSE